MKTFKEKGLWILFGQFLFLDFPLRVFLVGPPNHTFMCSSKTSNIAKNSIEFVWNLKKNMFVQNLWASKCKNDMKNIYFLYVNDVFFSLMLSLCEVHMMYNLTKFVQLLWCNFA